LDITGLERVKALATRSWLSDNMSHMLALLGLTTLASSKRDKRYERPCCGPGCLCVIVFLFLTIVCL